MPKETYKVKKGDSYWDIAKRKLGAKATDADVNKLRKQIQAENNNKALYAGTVLKYSVKDASKTDKGTKTTKATSASEKARQAIVADKKKTPMAKGSNPGMSKPTAAQKNWMKMSQDKKKTAVTSDKKKSSNPSIVRNPNTKSSKPTGVMNNLKKDPNAKPKAKKEYTIVDGKVKRK
jgi:hypothetical protein